MEIGYYRFREDLKMVKQRGYSCGVEREIKGLADLLEEEGEMGFVLGLQAKLLAVNKNESLLGDGITDDGDGEKEIVLLRYFKRSIFNDKSERGRFFVEGRVVDETFGGFGNERRDDDEKNQEYSEGDGGILDVAFVGFEIDSLMEWEGGELVGFLTYAGKEKIVCGSIFEFLELQEVEEFVLDFGEVVADDAGSLVVGDGLSKAEHLSKRNYIIKNDDKKSDKDVRPKENGA